MRLSHHHPLILALLLLVLQPVAPSAPEEDATAAATIIDDIVSWLEEGGADLSAVSVGAGVGGERGVRTARDVAAGEVILRGVAAPPHPLGALTP
jgi:hypothetical protein